MTIARQVITIYNKCFDDASPPYPPSTTWIKTVLKNCQFEDKVQRSFNGNGIITIDKSNLVIIPHVKRAKPYMQENEWEKLPNEQKAGYWTLKAGDYISLGDTPEITGEFTIIKLTTDYKAFLIKEITDLSGQPVLPHFEVQGI